MIKGNRISIAIGVLIAGVGTRFLEDGNLLVTSVITLFCATVTRLAWELVKFVKRYFATRPSINFTDTRLDPNDNQYRRIQFEMKEAGGLNGQMMRRVANFTNPKRLDEE
jgi:hypothetical protein